MMMQRTKFLILGIAGALLLIAGTPRTSEAIPAWARKYEANCSLCHYPSPPRLNSLGHRFRRAGYRMSGEMNAHQEIAKVGNFLAVRARARYNYVNPEVGRTDNEFQLNDVTIFYSGALSTHFSVFTETEVEGETGEVGLLGQASGIWGEWDNFASFRVGQMHTLTRAGFGGLDRPTGISGPLVLSARLTQSAGGIPFRLSEDQRGLELTYVYGPGRIIGQILNGVNESGNGTAGDFDKDQEKDYFIAYEHILDEIASGFTVFGYRGTEHLTFIDKSPKDKVDFYRYGVTAAKVFDNGLEVQGGYVRGFDDLPGTIVGDPATGATPKPASDINSQGAWVEIEYYIQSINLTPFGRVDWVDPKTSGGDNNQVQGTAGVAALVEDIVRPALEVQVLDKEASNTTDYKVVAELMFNF